MARPKKPKPETEVKLDALQERYLEDPQNVEVFKEYFTLIKSHARSICLKEIKSKIYLEPDRVEEVAVEATLKFLNQYRRKDWRVWGSFFGAIRWKVVEALYEDAEEESTVSMNLYVGDSTTELGDILKKIGARQIWSVAGLDPQETFMASADVSFSEIKSLLEEADAILDARLQLLFRAYLLLRLRRPKTRQVLSSFTTLFLTTKEEEAFELLLLELRNRIADTESVLSED